MAVGIIPQIVSSNEFVEEEKKEKLSFKLYKTAGARLGRIQLNTDGIA